MVWHRQSEQSRLKDDEVFVKKDSQGFLTKSPCLVQEKQTRQGYGNIKNRWLEPCRLAVYVEGLIEMGRIRRLQQKDYRTNESRPLMCPLCQREIPSSQRDAHHLTPKSKGGKHTEFMHRICHRQIHALFSETRLARQLNTVEALLEQTEIIRFVQWVKTKPNDFYLRTRRSQKISNLTAQVLSPHE